METPRRQWIEVILSSEAPAWKYDFQVKELTSLVLRDNLFSFNATVLEGNITARPGAWRVLLRCSTPESAAHLNEIILSGRIARIELGNEVEGIMVLTGETMVCRGFGEEDIRSQMTGCGRVIRELESRTDGMAVYFVEPQ